MNKYSDPLDYIIWCCENDFKPSSFDILNAKDELAKLRNFSKFEIAFWARLNNRGDLYDPSIVYNPHLNQDTVLPIYANKEEYEAKYGKLSK